MDLPGPQRSFLRQFGPQGQILGPRPLWPQFKNCNFLTKPYNMGVYRLAWTPKFIFKIISTPGAKFWVQGPFGPKLKNCYFPTKPSNIGVYGLAWIPATTLKVIWTRGPNFWSKGPLAPNSKICNFLTKPHKMGVYGITWTPAIILGWFGPWSQIFAQGPFGPKLKKMQFSHKTPQYGCLWTHLNPSNHVWGNLDPIAKF